MPEPKQSPIANCVVRVIGRAANYDHAQIEESHELRNRPLHLDENQLAWMCDQLRKLAELLGADQDLVDARVVEKSGATVKTVVDHLQAVVEA